MFPFNQNRLRSLKEGIIGHGPVGYWMSRDQRVEDNWALLWAQELALKQGTPFAVVFCLVPEFLNAAQRQYGFMLKGLQEVEDRLAKMNISFHLLTGQPDSAVVEWLRINGIKVLATDFDPLRIKRTWKKRVADKIKIPFYEIDAHNIVPCWIASPKQEYGAYTIRPKIRRVLEGYLDPFPKLKSHPVSWKEKTTITDWNNAMCSIAADRPALSEVDWIRPGEKAAHAALHQFIKNKLSFYDELSNDPVADGQSNFSPYLHFGQLSAQRAALEVMNADAPQEAKEDFLEELIVRRELADNFCFYNPEYDRFDGFPDWAKKTLNAHRQDPRSYVYDIEQFEKAQTHDELWNAAQMEMVIQGKMHGYMRMYWAKKILEWSPSPEAAVETAIYLNDRYELDGRDPNGYAGIAWSIGGVHDRAWNERAVFGKVRYMSYNGCKSKFDIKKYIQRINQT